MNVRSLRLSKSIEELADRRCRHQFRGLHFWSYEPVCDIEIERKLNNIASAEMVRTMPQFRWLLAAASTILALN